MDAGSGTGYLARMMTKRGAEVTAVEPATNLFNYAKQREVDDPLGITYVQQDLCEIEYTAKFDAVVSNMVLMDIPDWQTAAKKCLTALKPGGVFIFSIIHPAFEERHAQFEEKGYIAVREYFAEYDIAQEYGHAFHRPLSSYLNLMADEGATIKRVVEPQLVEDIPGNSRNYHVPHFIVIKCEAKQ